MRRDYIYVLCHTCVHVCKLMTDIFPSSTHLSAQMFLHHPRYFPGVSPHVIFDASVGTLSPHQQTIWCSLRYDFRYSLCTVHPSVYDIVTKVSLQTLICLYITSFSQVVNFEQDSHQRTIHDGMHECHLMGDILVVHFCSISSHVI